MAADREVLREVWEGKLPVCFQLNSNEVEIQSPEPYYLLIPRLSYFPLVTDKVRKHFVKYIEQDKQDAEMWLEYNGAALKWHYPIGVLFDLNSADIQLPWVITVRFDKIPEDLLYCSSRENVESHFLARLKEADVLKHKTQIVANMQRKDHNQLWLGLQKDKFDQFWAVNRKLMEIGANEDAFKYIPFRCYYKDEHHVQKLVKPVSDSGERKTLQHLLGEIYPDQDSENWKVITHGIELPKETPLQWMSEHLSYPDNFLHLILSLKT